MRRFLLLVVVSSFSFAGQIKAQEPHPDYFTFKGIPIDGSLSYFMQRLIVEGYLDRKIEFLGHQAKISVVGDGSGMVERVQIWFEDPDLDAATIESNRYTALYIEKYGFPSCYGLIYDPDDENIVYLHTDWENLPQGKITLSVSVEADERGVLIEYQDNLDRTATSKSELEDI